MKRIALIRLLVMAGAVALVEVLCRTGAISRFTMLPPSEMAVALWGLARSGTVTADLLFTVINITVAVAIAVAGGFAIGAFLHGVPRLRAVVSPLLAGYYAVPIFVFYPLLIVLLGLNRLPLIAIGALAGIVAMIVNTLDGLDRIPRVFVKTARSHRMNALSTALLVKLPAAAPHLVTGIKLAITYSLIGTIAGEFLLSVAGIGRHVAIAYNNLDNRTMYALLLLLLSSVTVVNVVVHEWDRRLRRRWGRP
ncbi:MAG TPA: ABC transporter permease subunit [Candidatus Binatia bacterium]|nr:ABC transporter permease subunit [Candidatus Binatia bacterium]